MRAPVAIVVGLAACAAACAGANDRAATSFSTASSATTPTVLEVTTSTSATTSTTAANALPTSVPASATPPTPPTPAVPPLDWSACGGAFQCATLTVPLDHAAPTAGDQIELPVIRRPATSSQERVGSVVMNPGGPGSSGVQFLRSASAIFADLNSRFDLVSFDPRGVGSSTPAIRCHETLDDTVDVSGPGGLTEDRLRARIEADKARCSSTNVGLLTHVGTNDAARDLDWLRAALGDSKLTYLGFSYGTRLGSVYTELYPNGARAVALDGADIPTRAISRSIADQYLGFEQSFTRFAAWCDGPSSGNCPTKEFGGAVATFRLVERRLRDGGPLPTDLGTRRLTLGEFYYGVVAALYSTGNWEPLAAALYNAEALEDGTAIQQFVDNLFDRKSDGSYANLIDANVAVNCADDPERPTFVDALARGRELARTLTYFGPLAETAFMDCVGWGPAADPVVIPSGKVTVPVLVVGTTGDPATPYAWAGELARALVAAHVLTYNGDGHTAYFSSGCVRRAVNAYLVSLTLPTGTDC